MRMKYKISVKTLQGDILTYTTDNYGIEDGFVVWLDVKTNSIKRFHSSNCEIQEVKE